MGFFGKIMVKKIVFFFVYKYVNVFLIDNVFKMYLFYLPFPYVYMTRKD